MSVMEQDLDQDGILTIRFNRPDKLNAMNAEALDALAEIFSQAKTNPKVKALMLTGNGKAFCAGADINRLAECNGQNAYEFACRGQEVFALLEHLGKPSLSAVNGFAFGGGCELAISTTMRIAANKAQFGQPEVKIGVIPGYGGTQRLARLVGKGRALDLCLTGRFIDANTALQWGLVTHVFADEVLLDEGKKILKGIISLAPLAIAGVIETINHGYDLPLNEALHLEAVRFGLVCASEDKKEGVGAFLEKRPAQFKGV